MGHTNSTANLALPQFIGTDKPTWLGDINSAFSAIDAYAGTNDAAVSGAVSDAASAISQSASAVSTANAANTTAGNASTAATNAVGTANNAMSLINQTNIKIGTLANLDTTDKTSIVNAINEVVSGITKDITSEFTLNTAHDAFKAIKIGKLIYVIGLINATTANATALYDLPSAYTVDEAATTTYEGVIYRYYTNTKPGGLSITTGGTVSLVNIEGSDMELISYSVLIPIQ